MTTEFQFPGAAEIRSAALREAAALLDQRASSIDALSSSGFGEEARAVRELAEAAETLRRMADEAAVAPCGECSHPQAVHGEGDDPVSPGRCASCPDDDAWHNYQPAAGARMADETATTETPHTCDNCDGIDPDTCFNNPSRPPEQCPAAEFEDYGQQCQKPAGHNLHSFEEQPTAGARQDGAQP